MSSEKILVVDDEERIVDNISLCLQREGFQTVGAECPSLQNDRQR